MAKRLAPADAAYCWRPSLSAIFWLKPVTDIFSIPQSGSISEGATVNTLLAAEAG
jgi:hypothetical protein